MKHRLIGISGKKQHGKDTVAKIIQDMYPDEYIILKFADKLKDMVCVLLDCTRMELEDPKYKETPLGEKWEKFTTHDAGPFGEITTSYYLTPRLILQLLGTECGREIIHPNIWVNVTMNTVAKNQLPGAIITDVRFPNEAEAIKKAGGILIRVERVDMESSDNHPSETSLDDYDDFDYIVYNDKDIIELTKKINECF